MSEAVDPQSDVRLTSMGASAASLQEAGARFADAPELLMPPVDFTPITLTRRADAPPIGAELEALTAFRAAAKRLKTAEAEYRAAQQGYAEAVKQLSEEATK